MNYALVAGECSYRLFRRQSRTDRPASCWCSNRYSNSVIVAAFWLIAQLTLVVAHTAAVFWILPGLVASVVSVAKGAKLNALLYLAFVLFLVVVFAFTGVLFRR